MGLSCRKKLRLKDFDYGSPYIYSITICSYNKKPIFTISEINARIIDCLHITKKELAFKIYVYCLMPNHLHLLISPMGLIPMSTFVRYFKGRTAKLFRKFGYKERIWQRSFYDHIVRKSEGLKNIAEYILANPVRKELVKKAEEYVYAGYIDDLPI